MASEEDKLGDVISIGDNSEDDVVSGSAKRSVQDIESEEEVFEAFPAKRQRLSETSTNGADVGLSEEGEINESQGNSDAPESSRSQASAKAFIKNAESSGPLDPSAGATMTANARTFEANGLSWKMPIMSDKKEGSWIARIKDWIVVALVGNADIATQFTPAVAVAAFKDYLNSLQLKTSKRKSAVHTMDMFLRSGNLAEFLATANGVPMEPAEAAEDRVVVDLTSPAGRAIDTTTNGEAEAEAEAPVVIEEKRVVPKREPTAEQKRYFPSAEDPANMCVKCGSERHAIEGCTPFKCQFCDGEDDWEYACTKAPSRCGKCLQLGHLSKECVEKLALTREEGLACAFCKVSDHLENSCTEPWRSFHANADNIKQVKSIEASCAVCGSRNHFASDCTLRGHDPTNPTWTLANRNKYVNPESDAVSIEVAVAQSRIRGRAAAEPRGGQRKLGPRTHVHYSETDDSEPEFLGSHTVRRPAPVGKIRMSSNIQLPSKPSFSQPPLPPGPPPRGPPPREASASRYNPYQPIANPPGLPMKPPKNYRNEPLPPPPPASSRRPGRSRSGVPPSRGGGRGGRGGGGGGRPRGRGGKGRGR
ncbi:hypothetical protein VHEMI02606 [[Torrubiella] hemipterigena]|uniref:CCHC-type domain-containing protein n=1 Tax=[Torrubiella] hemipterigena TaxID=1531966 RepID=A0A0A1T8E5_9HYPO|nr:hypothetical protein VHEMI02606 [[Torrubiella] hemipterigena]